MNMRKPIVVLVFFCIVIEAVFMGGCTQRTSNSDQASQSSPYKIANGEKLVLYMGIGVLEAQKYTTLNNHPVVLEMERSTGVNLDFRHPPIGDDGTYLTMTIASGDWPDLWQVDWTAYPGGVDGAIKDGMLINPNLYVEKDAPHFLAKYNSFDSVTKKNFLNDSGLFVKLGIPMDCKILDGVQHTGGIVRLDALDKLGMDVPMTLDEFTECLRALKKAGFKTPLGLFKFTDYQAYNSNFIATAFGVSINTTKGFLVDADKKSHYSMIQDGYRDYLQYLNQLYNEGLIDRDFVNRSQDDTKKLLYNGSVAVMSIGNWEITEIIRLGRMENPSFDMAGIRPIRKNSNDIITVGGTREQGNDGNAGWQISSTCKIPDIAMRFVDYLYTDEGLILANYGPQKADGQTIWTLENGHYQFTDYIMRNPDTPFNSIRGFYTIQSFQTYFHDDYQALQYNDQHCYDNWDAWRYNLNNTGLVPQAASLTVDESTTVVKLMSAITSYADEMTYKFIFGEAPLSEWNAFTTRIKSMNIAEVEKIYSDATARYFAR
jgi:putative aldouronate transport system substrate-binding protein